MSDPTAEFFDGLGHRGHEPLLQEATGTIRFDLEHDHGVDRWFVVIQQGDVRVSREEREADSVVRVDKGLFDRIVSGEENLYAAWVRNELRAEGEVRLARLIQRVFPGPPGAHDPRMFARERRRQA
ncbi:SCP-2 sterol transfer family protein [Micromonospora kangleipakensis]|uniref:SCP-2 sterol transfer family protein n=1 Tax=Micromonospora kangleipakensis TaxID=1077942 RepID=A0A4Q8BE63_9ACTN|nr:SCP2 sterol-binding domain-containing protein [Micromonospora kangleipakensis]RZU75615.1 SCP-2 sterol transfer family protein [Micromonospora kangleipakensis]